VRGWRCRFQIEGEPVADRQSADDRSKLAVIVQTLAVLVLVLLSAARSWAQDPESRPATRPAGEPTAAEWQEWMEGLAPKPGADDFLRAEYERSAAGFTATRLKDCGATPIEIKGEKPSFLQRVLYTVAGFDPKQTFVQATRPSGGKIEFGNGFGVRGVESLDVAGIAEMCVGDAKSQKTEGSEDAIDPEVMRKILEGFLNGGPITIDATKLQNVVRVWDPKNRVVLTAVKNNDQNPASVPRFARGLKGRGARAVVLIDDRGAAATSGPPGVSRRDRYRHPNAEDPPALFVTEQAAKKLGDWAGVPIDLILSPGGGAGGPALDATRSELRVSVKYRKLDVDIPNVVGKLGSGSGEFVLVSAPGGGSGNLAAALLATTRLLSGMPPPARRSVIVAVHSRPELPAGGQDWFLGHPLLPLGRIVAAVHLAAIDGAFDSSQSGSVQLLSAARGSQDLQALAAEALRANGGAAVAAGKSTDAQRAVDAYVSRGIPAIGLLATGETMEDGLALARVASALARALADREARPAAPGK
jgi:hypothetical protein